VATSRRRERELARRRFERRRQLEMERRAKAKKRNTVLGASAGTAAVIAVAVLLIVHFLDNPPKKHPTAAPPAAASTSGPTPTPSPTASTAPAKAPTKCAKISPDPTAKGQPTVPQVKGKLSKKLVVNDVKVGHGPAAKAGSNLSVTYIGVSCDTGKVFDASYKHGGQPFPVTSLGKANVIQGWNKGLVGVKAGGIRELVIPAKLGYGSQGQPPAIAPNDTLVFLITVKSVKA
jgi:peptidylprolyl isomerase